MCAKRRSSFPSECHFNGRILLSGSPFFGAGRLVVIAAWTLGLFPTLQPVARAQMTGIRANPTTYQTYNNVTPAYDPMAEEMSLNVNNPPASRYNAIATPPPAQYSFVQTSDGTNILSAVVDRQDRLQNTLPNPAAGGLAPNQTLGGLVAGRAWNAADVMMQQCFSGGFAWNMQGSLQPSAGVGVRNTIPYTFAAAANFNEFSYEAQLPKVNAPPNGAGATTALGDFTQGHAWSNWNSLPLPANNTYSRYASYQTGVLRDPFTARNTTADWGNTNFFGLANRSFESPVYASSDAMPGGGNARTMTQVAANPTYAVLMAFSATNDNRFVLDLERQYVALRSNGIPANQIAVLYGDGTVKQLGSFSNIVAANQRPNFGGVYGAGFTMPVFGGVSAGNVTALLNGTGWGAVVPAAARLYVYTTGHGGAVNVANVPIGTNEIGNAVITTLTLSGPPNPTPFTTLQIASNALLPANILADNVLVDGNLLPTTLTLDSTPFDVSSLIPNYGGQPLYYYDISVPQSYYTLDGNGTYTLGLQENGSLALSDLSAFDASLAAVTMMDGDASLGPSGSVDTYTDLPGAAAPEPSAFVLMLIGSAALFAAARVRRQGRAY